MRKLSVILPVYNVEKYLRECLDSVLSQEFEDYEVICVEDCSTDHSMDILKEYECRYPQLRVIQHEQNRGQSAARNTGMKEAIGKYIQFIDPDDMIKPNTFATLYSCAEEHGLDVVYFDLEFLNDEEHYLIRRKKNLKCIDGVKTGRELFCLHQQAKTIMSSACTMFIRRDYLQEHKLTFYEGIFFEDNLFTFLVAMTAKRVIQLKKELYIYRQRSDSTIWSKKHKHASSLFVCILHTCNYWFSNDFSEEENRWIASYLEEIYQSFLYARCHQEKACAEGGVKEKALYEMLFRRKRFTIRFEEQDLAILRNSPQNILYGAREKAFEVFELLKTYGIPIHKVAVSEKKGNASYMNGIPVSEISELLDDKDGVVILGTEERYHDEILHTLENLGFRNYIKPQKQPVSR
jgi:glycosyltransferase involved in cell wall biosynthesis